MTEPEATQREGQVVFDVTDEDAPGDRERWAEAAPKLAMALSEAGYPTDFQPFSFVQPHRENELVFRCVMPPADVIQRAGDLCGVGDLVAAIEWKDPVG